MTPCNVCQSEATARLKVFRLGTGGQVLGILCYIPSVLMLLTGLVGCWATGSAVTATAEQMDREERSFLADHDIPPDVIELIADNRPVPDDRMAELTDDQRAAIEASQFTQAGGAIGAAGAGILAGGISGALVFLGLAGCGLGVLLRLRKRVLACASCGNIRGAVV